MRVRAFPGIISAWKVSAGELHTYTNPRLGAEEGANAHPIDMAERRDNASPGTALEVGYATGIAADRFAQVKERAAEPAAAAEGDAQVGASTAERMCTLPGAWRCLGLSLLLVGHISSRRTIMIGCVV